MPLSSPIPRRDLQKKKLYISVPTVVANRGCMNNCEFCSIPRMWGNKNFTRPIDEVINEIKELRSKRILFLDPSPTSNKAYAKEFFKALIPLKIKWAGLATSNITRDKQLFDLIKKSGCISILIGFESHSRESINASRKGFNRVEEYRNGLLKYIYFYEDNIRKRLMGDAVRFEEYDTSGNLIDVIDHTKLGFLKLHDIFDEQEVFFSDVPYFRDY